MFKSIFGKYLTAFTVILLLCIVVILASVGATVADSTRASLAAVMESAAENIVIAIEATGGDVASAGAGAEVARMCASARHSAEADVYIFDSEGRAVNGEKPLPGAALDKMLAVSGAYGISAVEGFFDRSRANVYRVGRLNGESFVVMLSREAAGGDSLSKKLAEATIGVSLWVFLAAMISLYIISLRTTRPLSEIVSAAKSYAKGRFDRKITVSGHDEVAELAAAINEMAASLETLEEKRNSFVGNVSHDLRTPMTTIGGFVDGILDGTIPPEKHEYYLGIVSGEIHRLSRLINQLLEISRLEGGTDLKFSEFNLTEKGRTVLISLESKITAKNIEIEFESGDEDLFVRADPDSIHRVIYNLLDNAVKFTPESGKISIRIAPVSDGRRRRKAMFSVRNTGEGISENDLIHIFDRFYKADRSRGLDKSGTGLGLFIAKTSVNKHGEDLTASSVEGEYTEFRFTLPLAEG